jgi:hypothetical protein
MMRSLRMMVALAGTFVLVACVSESSDGRFVETVPDRTSFPVVSDLLDHRCGTLDCHGVTYRNLRIYGREGLRLATDARPSSVLGTTTVPEYDATFQSLVALEPEIMTAVVKDSGAHPERLTFVRKARGTEDHKGLMVWNEGSPEDICVTSWLAGKVDTATCLAAIAVK